VHRDDFPNIYYTVKLHQPLETINATWEDTEALVFYTEKQTDSFRLLHVREDAKSMVWKAGAESDRYHRMLFLVLFYGTLYNIFRIFGDAFCCCLFCIWCVAYYCPRAHSLSS
jgi:hypothetical protein